MIGIQMAANWRRTSSSANLIDQRRDSKRASYTATSRHTLDRLGLAKLLRRKEPVLLHHTAVPRPIAENIRYDVEGLSVRLSTREHTETIAQGVAPCNGRREREAYVFVHPGRPRTDNRSTPPVRPPAFTFLPQVAPDPLWTVYENSLANQGEDDFLVRPRCPPGRNYLGLAPHRGAPAARYGSARKTRAGQGG